jgi:hypothetical protein
VKTIQSAIVVLAVLAAGAVLPFPASGADAFRPGELWPDNHGVAINCHGGGILYHEGLYWWFGQHMIEGAAGNQAMVGVHAYSSADLYHWQDQGIALRVSDDPKSEITRGCILERPKVVFNRGSGKFVMWFHLELKGQGYTAARAGVAVSDTAAGPYKYLGSVRPNAGVLPLGGSAELRQPLNAVEQEMLRTRRKPKTLCEEAMADLHFRRDFAIGHDVRDMTVYEDDDHAVYLIFASEMNWSLHVVRLSDDYLRPSDQYARVLLGKQYEGPALLKHSGKYWLFGSHCTGWAPNAARLAVADSIFGPYRELGNPWQGPAEQTKISFDSQSTFVLPVVGRAGAFIYLADRWRPKNAIDGRHIWLPVLWHDGQPRLEWMDRWDLGIFDRRPDTRAGAAAASPTHEKIVYTHVMHQAAVGAVNGRNETHLSVEPTRPNGMMALHLPEYIANYGKPAAAARQDIAMMKATGVNTIGLLLGNKHLPHSQFAAMIHAYYQAALADGGIKIVPDVWGDLTQPDSLAVALGLIHEKYAPVWLRRKGRLVVSLWLDYGSHPLPDYAETMRRLCRQIGGREQVYFVFYSPAALKTHNPQWFAGADAFGDWVHDSYALDQSLLREAMAVAKAAGKEFWQPVMPSFTQSRYPHPGVTPNVREMLGMTWFREAWLAAIHADAPAACLQTWNDLSEDSSVMPESNHGYAYYELNKYYARWFRSGCQPAVEKEQVLLFHHPQIVEGVQLPAGRKPMEGFPVSHGKRFADATTGRTPPTDYLGVVAMLKSPAKVTVMLGETVMAERELPAGVTSWLVYQPREQNDPRKLYACDAANAYPKAEADFLVTTLSKPFWDAEVYLAVYRGADRIGFFRSHRPIASAAARGELTTIGDAFKLEE